MQTIPFSIGVDLGTTNCKVVAVSDCGSLLASASSDYSLYTPHSGWVEQKPEEVWAGVLIALRSLLLKLPDGAQAAGLSLSGAMHSSFPMDAAGQPLAPAMTWADQRATPQAAALRARCDPHALYLRTGCPVTPFYHLSKLRWWLEEASDLVRGTAKFVMIKDWVLYRLTGALVSDLSMASSTGLLDNRRLDWDPEALDLAGVKPGQLPRLISPSAVVGSLLPAAAQATGLTGGLPVVAGASDGGLANLGAGAAAPGQSVITVGTSGAVRRLVAEPLLDPRERTWCYLVSEGRWFAGGAINNGGLALRWVRERFYPEMEGEAGFVRLMDEAASVAPGAGGVLLLPYFTGERSPHWDPAVRATLAGLGLEHGRPHIARAVLEGVAFCLADVWEALAAAPVSADPVHLTGGITHSPLWEQIVADVIGIPMAPVDVADASALGAAMLAQWGIGAAPSLESLAQRVTAGGRLEPDTQRHADYREQHLRWQRLYTIGSGKGG
jgi:gluconokinase